MARPAGAEQRAEVEQRALVARLRAAGCVFAEDEARLLRAATGDPARLAALVAARIAGAPLEHVLGWVRFAGQRIAVDPGVFVPRPRTELLVRQAAALAPPRPTIVDLACGSGALGVVTARLTRATEVYAVDIDAVAVACARRNLMPWGGHAYQGDLYEPLPSALRGRVDLLLANVPYVPSDAVPLLPREARLYEPLVALDGGADGLALARRVAAGAPDWLAPGGALLVETGADQVDAARDSFARAGLAPSVVLDADGDATVVIGRRVS